jgi:hypothetical protein
MLSEAVQAWYRSYEVDPDERPSQILCAAAIDFFNGGHRSPDDLSTIRQRPCSRYQEPGSARSK